MIALSRNPSSAPTQPASFPVRGIARVTQMLGRVANRVRTALTRTKPTTQPPQQAPKEAEAPTRRKPKTQPPTPHIDDDLFADFCNAETIGEIFASFCRILNINEHSPLYPAKLIALTQTPEQFAATRQPNPAPAPTPTPRATRAPTPRPLPQAAAAAPRRTPHQNPQSPPHRAPTTPSLHPPSPPPFQTARTHDPPRKKTAGHPSQRPCPCP